MFMQRLYTVGYGSMEQYEIVYMSEDLECAIAKVWLMVTNNVYTEPLLHLAVYVDGKAEKCVMFSPEDREDLHDVDFDEFYLCITKDNEFE